MDAHIVHSSFKISSTYYKFSYRYLNFIQRIIGVIFFLLIDFYVVMLENEKANFPSEANVDLNVDVVSVTTLIRAR